jgi:two-component system, NarL family, sensor kinase
MTEPSTRRLRLKVFVLAGLSLLAALGLIGITVSRESELAAGRAIESVRPLLRDALEAELQNYVGLALQAIAQEPSPGAAIEVLRHLDFGWDGYFYVMDFDGKMLLHSRQPEREGVNHVDDRAGDGSFPIREILARSRQGDGFVEYLWRRPSSGIEERKLGYVATLPALQWVVGSGIYLGSLDEGTARIRAAFSGAIQRTLTTLFVIAALCAALVAFSGLALNLSEQRLAQARMRALAGQAVLELEDERRKLSRKLHEDAMQDLTAIKLALEVTEAPVSRLDPSLGHALRRDIRQLQETMRGLRQLSHRLRPRLLDQLGLPDALSELLRELESQTGVTTRLHVKVSRAPLSDALSIALFRVIGEALANVSKHAEAARVDLWLEQADDGALDVRIRDDGRGFDAMSCRAWSSGRGLVHMRDRVRALGGELSLRSGRRGTELQIHLPKEVLDEHGCGRES